jgi:hypothetical protein
VPFHAGCSGFESRNSQRKNSNTNGLIKNKSLSLSFSLSLSHSLSVTFRFTFTSPLLPPPCSAPVAVRAARGSGRWAVSAPRTAASWTTATATTASAPSPCSAVPRAGSRAPLRGSRRPGGRWVSGPVEEGVGLEGWGWYLGPVSLKRIGGKIAPKMV